MLLSFISAALGGLLASTAVFVGLGYWGLVFGAAVTLGFAVAFARRSTAPGAFGLIAAFGFAFVLLIWPLLWLLVGYARYLLTGETLGS